MIPDAQIWPVTADLDPQGRMMIGGCSVPRLAAEFGTPLYIFDEPTIRRQCAAYRDALAETYPGPGAVHYAAKALLNLALVGILRSEGLGLDVVSAGELAAGLRGGMPAPSMHLHGNAKPRAELAAAIAAGIGAIVVDSLDELDSLAALTAELGRGQDILLRVAPGVAPDTHPHISTGARDAKFGLPIALLDAAAARLHQAPQLKLRGLHCHLGSQILDPSPYDAAIVILMEAAAMLRTRHGIAIDTISPGGGLGIAYQASDETVEVTRFVGQIAKSVAKAARVHDLPLPHLVLEPGRSIVGRAGVAIYSVVARKPLEDVGSIPRGFLHLDGGIGDNIRPALYGARYTIAWPRRMRATLSARAHLSGRYCESSDILLRDVAAPRDAAPGELIAFAAAGAYTLSMANTYNFVPRPAVVLVQDGQARLIQRRESFDDLMSRDITEGGSEAAATRKQGRKRIHAQEDDGLRPRGGAAAGGGRLGAQP